MRYGRIFYLVVLLVCIFEMARLWNISPQQMAAHFNIQGEPDRFVSKVEFFWFAAQTLLIVMGVSILPQVLILALPVKWINMPNREYWLAPERSDETVSRLSAFGAIMFGIILLVIQAGFDLSVYANLRTPIIFNAQGMQTIMIVAFAAMGLLLALLIISFYRKPAQVES